MLQITADIFSGRPNPSWILTDEKEARAVLKEFAQNRKIISQVALPEAGLGFRGFIVEPLSDEVARDFDLPTSMYMAAGPYAASAKANELAERFIGLVTMAEAPFEAAEEMLSLDESLQSFLREQLEISGRTSALDTRGLPGATEEAISEAVAAVSCTIELAAYNPGFWNKDPYICQHNNCYHYASNKRRDTFRIQPGGGQPGAGCGHMYTEITCAEITRAALCDGLHKRYDCFPSSEAPRYLVAMVVIPDPNPNRRDFHWYRKMKEGFWGHKPGSTPVRNVDNSGRVISDPATCDRGPYTQFCGYFYTCRSQRIR